MTDFFNMLFQFYANIFNRFERFNFSIFGYNLNLFEIFLGCFVISLAISIFWRGAKG